MRAISDLERGLTYTPRGATIQLLVEALELAGDERARSEAAAGGEPGSPAASIFVPVPSDLSPRPTQLSSPGSALPVNAAAGQASSGENGHALPVQLTTLIGRERETDVVRVRHAELYLGLAESAEPELRRGEQV